MKKSTWGEIAPLGEFGPGPVQLPLDSHCENCGDAENELNLLDSTCFPCRVVLAKKHGTRLKIRGWH